MACGQTGSGAEGGGRRTHPCTEGGVEQLGAGAQRGDEVTGREAYAYSRGPLGEAGSVQAAMVSGPNTRTPARRVLLSGVSCCAEGCVSRLEPSLDDGGRHRGGQLQQRAQRGGELAQLRLAADAKHVAGSNLERVRGSPLTLTRAGSNLKTTEDAESLPRSLSGHGVGGRVRARSLPWLTSASVSAASAAAARPELRTQGRGGPWQ